MSNLDERRQIFQLKWTVSANTLCIRQCDGRMGHPYHCSSARTAECKRLRKSILGHNKSKWSHAFCMHFTNTIIIRNKANVATTTPPPNQQCGKKEINILKILWSNNDGKERAYQLSATISCPLQIYGENALLWSSITYWLALCLSILGVAVSVFVLLSSSTSSFSFLFCHQLIKNMFRAMLQHRTVYQLFALRGMHRFCHFSCAPLYHWRWYK